MNKEDEEKTSFTTPFGTYCYIRMPEGLRNAGCTFNRMIKKVLGDQLAETSPLMWMTWSFGARKKKITYKIFMKHLQTFAGTG